MTEMQQEKLDAFKLLVEREMAVNYDLIFVMTSGIYTCPVNRRHHNTLKS